MGWDDDDGDDNDDDDECYWLPSQQHIIFEQVKSE